VVSLLEKNDHLAIVVEDEGKVKSTIIGVAALDLTKLVIGSPALQYELELKDPNHKDAASGSVKITVWITREEQEKKEEKKDHDKKDKKEEKDKK